MANEIASHRSRFLVASYAVVLAVASTAIAQDTALIIGNHDYDAGSGASDLPGVVPDIALMKSKLENAGWNTVVRTNRTAAQMIADITANSPPGSRKYVVYYAGHGNNNPGEHGQWVGRDGSEMSAQDYVNALGTRANKTLTILDSCGGGEFADTVNGLAPGIGFITSTTDLECADKGPGGGVFTQCFGNALNTTADQMPNGNANGETSAQEAANYGINNCGTVDQHPTWDGDHGGYILGRPKPDPIPTVSEWGLIIMGLLLLTAGTIISSRRHVTSGGHSLARNTTAHTICFVLVWLGLATTTAAQQPAPASMKDLACFKVGQPCNANVPAGWMAGEVADKARAICKLEIWAKPNGQPPAVQRGVASGWLIDHNMRNDVIVTNRHCVDPNFGFPPGSEEDDHDPSPNSAHREPLWQPGDVFSHVVAHFDLEYQLMMDPNDNNNIKCQCHLVAPPAVCNVGANPCDTPETATCTQPLTWVSSPEQCPNPGFPSWPNDGADWALVKVLPDNQNQLPGQVLPKLPLGMHQVMLSVVMAQHPQGRCKEVALGMTGAVEPDGWTFVHQIASQGGSSGSPILYRDGNGNITVVGVHYGRSIANPATKYAVTAQNITGGIAAALQRLDNCRNPKNIPTVSEWGLIILGLSLLTAGTIVVARHRSARDETAIG